MSVTPFAVAIAGPFTALALLTAFPATAEPAAGQGLGTYTCGEAAQASRANRSTDLLYFSLGPRAG